MHLLLLTFFQGSGLSGARKAVDDLRDKADLSYSEYEKEISKAAQETIQFTLERGAQFFPKTK
jgi:hypothetical protein